MSGFGISDFGNVFKKLDYQSDIQHPISET